MYSQAGTFLLFGIYENLQNFLIGRNTGNSAGFGDEKTRCCRGEGHDLPEFCFR